MRRPSVLLALLATLVLAACGAQPDTPAPTPSPSSTPTPAGPASCYLAPLRFQEMSVPQITEADYVHGPAEADIVIFEYADFQ